MKTEVIMKRELLGMQVQQKSKSGFLSANDLINAGNLYRLQNGLTPVSLQQYFNLQQTKDFMIELSKCYESVKVSKKGRGQQTWVHPILFMDIALWISPKMKMQVYEWILDNLLKYRNDSGNSYKLMTGAIFSNPNFNQSNFAQTIIKVSNRIANECGVSMTDKDKWQNATEYQLKLRDKMHEYISITCDLVTNLDDAIEIGIKKAKQCIM